MGHSSAWAQDEVAGLERWLGVALPAQARQYLRQNGRRVLGPDAMREAFGFLSACAERSLGRSLQAGEPFPITPQDMAKLLVHYQHHEPGAGLDRLLFPSDGWLPIVSHGMRSYGTNACDVLVTAGAFRGCVLYADRGYGWWLPYLSADAADPETGPTVMSFAEFSRTRLRAPPGPMRTPRPWCPRCAIVTVPVLYGRASPAAFKLADAGLASLGGCIVGPDSPRWQCPECYAGFGRLAGAG
jgi:hypothetical protein